MLVPEFRNLNPKNIDEVECSEIFRLFFLLGLRNELSKSNLA